ncbi:MAG TPA: hypothetical protein VF316_00440 [Polyangiaceae bacterium]
MQLDPPTPGIPAWPRVARALACALLVVACAKPTRGRGGAPAVSAPSSAGSMASPAGSVTAPPPRAATVNFEPAFTVPRFAGSFPHPKDPSVDEAGRLVDIVYSRPGGDAKLAPFFTLTNRTGKRLRVNQVWLFYYDAFGKELERYLDSLVSDLVLEPGESQERRLGRKLEDEKPGSVAFEGEVTNVYLGEERWFNENLIERRPRGGHSWPELVAMAGERVIVDVYALGSYLVRLTNVTRRPVRRIAVTLLYFDAEGRVAEAVGASYQKPDPPGWGGLPSTLQPGESLDVTLQPSHGVPPAKAFSVVGYASLVEFEDGTRFENKNLDSQARRLLPEADAAR